MGWCNSKNRDKYLIMGIFEDIERMLSVMVVAMVIVFVAMVVDLASGINKARLNGKIKTSWGLKRTMSKFIMYEGGLLIAGGVDVLMHFSHLYDLFCLHAIKGVPVITCLVGAFLCVVEFMSVREKASVKMKKEFGETAKMLGQLASREDFVKVLAEALRASASPRPASDNCDGVADAYREGEYDNN